jgi:hypothetical protein
MFSFGKVCFKRFFVLLVCVLAFAKAYPQQSGQVNSSHTQLKNTSFSVIDIKLAEHIMLEVITTGDDDVKIMESQHGEYKNALTLVAQLRNDSLIIEEVQNITFTYPNDKLGAHKVMDSRIQLSLPRNRKLVINARSADIQIDGDFKSVYINLFSGNCVVKNMSGDFEFISIYADLTFLPLDYKVTHSTKDYKKRLIIPQESMNYSAILETVHGSLKFE